MTQKKIKCFVAMAFGHTDCDLIYDRHILPVLRKLNVSPIRVDRKQHRDDLNNYIIRMLKESDIILADLTYARPSVYYEAGFAERFSPVIYTARADHLSRAQSDEQLRVHFDLEMKKIVAWRYPNDKTFSAHLKRRLTYLLRPIIADNTEKEKEHLEKQNFSKLSITERCNIVDASISAALKKKKFWLRSFAGIKYSLYRAVQPSIFFIGAKLVRKTVILSIVFIADSITKKQIQTITWQQNSTMLIQKNEKQNVTSYDVHYYFCSLRKTPHTRLTSVFPYAKPDNKIGSYNFPQTKTSIGEKETVNRKMWLISPIESQKMAKQIATDIANEHRTEKTNIYTGLLESYRYGPNYIVFKRPKK